MIELGKVQELEILREKDFGVYVGEDAGDEASVLLPKKQVPEGAKVGDRIQVFIYKDSSDRLIATTAAPKLQVGETAMLEVKDVAKIGAFLDMGLEKDCCCRSRNRPILGARGSAALLPFMWTRAGAWQPPCGYIPI